ncbi:MAG: hypothetical protein JWP03_4024 [Phycisphaerales bacterium]|nr:hypothetical protein [Phycisphaerales bacterium]
MSHAGCHRSAYSQTCALCATRKAQVSEYRDQWHPSFQFDPLPVTHLRNQSSVHTHRHRFRFRVSPLQAIAESQAVSLGIQMFRTVVPVKAARAATDQKVARTIRPPLRDGRMIVEQRLTVVRVFPQSRLGGLFDVSQRSGKKLPGRIARGEYIQDAQYFFNLYNPLADVTVNRGIDGCARGLPRRGRAPVQQKVQRPSILFTQFHFHGIPVHVSGGRPYYRRPWRDSPRPSHHPGCTKQFVVLGDLTVATPVTDGGSCPSFRWWLSTVPRSVLRPREAGTSPYRGEYRGFR